MAITIQANDREYQVRFGYTYETVPAVPGKEKSKEHNKPVTTRCELITNDEVLHTGIATCHSNDQFTYRKGRKWSLKFAMANAGWDKATRAQVWQQVMEYIRG